MNWSEPDIDPELEETLKAFLEEWERNPPKHGGHWTGQTSKPDYGLLRVAAEIVEAGYKELMKYRHPDCCLGDSSQLQKLNAARAWLRDRSQK